MILGPLAILLAWTTFAILFFTSDRTGQTTFSGLSTTRKRSYALFSSGLVVSGLLIFLFVKFWFAEALKLPDIFTYIVAFSTLILQPVGAIAPFKDENAKDTHNLAIYLEGALLPVMAVLIARSPILSIGVTVVCWSIIAFMLYLLFEFRRQFLKPRFIFVQVGYIACFHLIILIATFYALSRQ
jgi:hypothetical protein